MNHPPEETAQKIWKEVLETMPEELQSRYALTEARRRLIGKPDAQVLAKILKQYAVTAFGADQVLSDEENIAVKPQISEQLPTEAEVLTQVLNAVYDGFAATTDGTAERAKVLQDRALGNANRVIENNRRTLGWWSRRRLKSVARRAARIQAGLITNRPR